MAKNAYCAGAKAKIRSMIVLTQINGHFMRIMDRLTITECYTMRNHDSVTQNGLTMFTTCHCLSVTLTFRMLANVPQNVGKKN